MKHILAPNISFWNHFTPLLLRDLPNYSFPHIIYWYFFRLNLIFILFYLFEASANLWNYSTTITGPKNVHVDNFTKKKTFTANNHARAISFLIKKTERQTTDKHTHTIRPQHNSPLFIKTFQLSSNTRGPTTDIIATTLFKYLLRIHVLRRYIKCFFLYWRQFACFTETL